MHLYPRARSSLAPPTSPRPRAPYQRTFQCAWMRMTASRRSAAPRRPSQPRTCRCTTRAALSRSTSRRAARSSRPSRTARAALCAQYKRHAAWMISAAAPE
eukprot:116966-Chlamydomonas_euryale.AAC.5